MVTCSPYGSIYFAGLLHQARIRQLGSFGRVAEPIRKRPFAASPYPKSKNELPSSVASRPLLGTRQSQPLPAYRRYMSRKSRPISPSPVVNGVSDPEGILNDAAITLSRLLDASNVRSGLFGRYTMGVLRMPRANLDIDCIAGCSKNQIIELVHNMRKFKVVSQDRQDYVVFKWTGQKDRNHRIIVKVFCEKFPGSKYNMNDVPTMVRNVEGKTLGHGPVRLLDPFFLFKAKIHAAAMRASCYDLDDLEWLGTFYHPYIQARSHELNVELVGQVLKRYPSLDLLFRVLGINVNAAKDAAYHLSLPPIAMHIPGEVQAAILG